VLPDNHNHFVFHGDIDEMVTAAHAAGVGELAFTEHVFHIDEARGGSPYIATRFRPEGPPIPHEVYASTVARAAARADIALRLGIELDVRAEDDEMEAATNRFRDAYGAAWDVIIGSVHVIADDQAIEGEPVTHAPEFAWSDYLDRLTAAAASGRYDVISHPVRLARAVPTAPMFVGERLGDLARAAARADVALELNGTDFERRPDLVALLVDACARHRTPVSLGSDAHRPANAGRVLAARDLLRTHGITEVVGFEKRTRHALPI
jgi:HisJ family histidinol phosphate phosphatase